VLYESVTMKPPFRAEDMQGLYKKVLRGIYPKIPTAYSNELALLIKSLIQVSPNLRPSCDKILDMPSIKKRIDKLFSHEDKFFNSKS
jgi:NIMA (never in mitosis gene a)-related kinase